MTGALAREALRPAPPRPAAPRPDRRPAFAAAFLVIRSLRISPSSVRKAADILVEHRGARRRLLAPAGQDRRRASGRCREPSASAAAAARSPASSQAPVGAERGDQLRRSVVSGGTETRPAEPAPQRGLAVGERGAQLAALGGESRHQLGEALLGSVAGDDRQRLGQPGSLSRSARAAMTTASAASTSASPALRSSSTANSGGTPASSGKRRSSDWQKAWIVAILVPPGDVEHAREQLAGPGDVVFVGNAAGQLDQLLRQRAGRHRRPVGEPLVDPVRHLGGGGAGEGQAQDARRIGAVEHQRAAAGRSAPWSCRCRPRRRPRPIPGPQRAALRGLGRRDSSAARHAALIRSPRPPPGLGEPFEMGVIGIARRPARDRHRRDRACAGSSNRSISAATCGDHPIDQRRGSSLAIGWRDRRPDRRPTAASIRAPPARR